MVGVGVGWMVEKKELLWDYSLLWSLFIVGFIYVGNMVDIYFDCNGIFYMGVYEWGSRMSGV